MKNLLRFNYKKQKTKLFWKMKKRIAKRILRNNKKIQKGKQQK